jgi:hypothetical protein
MTFPTDYKFTMTVGERFREAGYRELLLRLLTNKLTEQCARSLHLEGTRLDFKTSMLTGRSWFSAGRIELHTGETPVTIDCALSVRRWMLAYLVLMCALAIASAFLPESMAPWSSFRVAAVSLFVWATGFFGTIQRFKETVREQIARADSEVSLRASILGQ